MQKRNTTEIYKRISSSRMRPCLDRSIIPEGVSATANLDNERNSADLFEARATESDKKHLHYGNVYLSQSMIMKKLHAIPNKDSGNTIDGLEEGELACSHRVSSRFELFNGVVEGIISAAPRSLGV